MKFLFTEAVEVGGGGGGETTAPAPAERWFDGAVKADASLAPHIPHLAQFESLSKFVEVAKGHQTAARQRQEGFIKLPGADAQPEEIAAYRKAIGIPDDHKGYGLDAAEDFRQAGLEWSPEIGEDYAKAAHALGLPKDKAPELVKMHLQLRGAEQAALAKAQAEFTEKEKAELTTAFGEKLNTVVLQSQRVGQTLGIDAAFFDPSSDKFMGFSGSQVLSMASELARLKGEASLPAAVSVGALKGSEQARDISTNPENPLYARYQKGDPEVVAMVDRLYGI